MNENKPKSSIAGKVFQQLQIIDIDPTPYYHRNGQRYKKYLCKCLNCGNVKSINLTNLHQGQKNCGDCEVIKMFDNDIYTILQSPFSKIVPTDKGYEAYAFNEYIGVFPTAKQAWAAKKYVELIILTGKDIENIK